MAGFFGLFDYTREGPGIDPDAAPRGPVVTFISIVGRKFGKLVGINLLYVLTNLPAILISFLLSAFVLPLLFPESLTANFIIRLTLITMMALVGFSFITVGPVQAGVTYTLRNYARETHAFIWSDFKDAARANFRQSTWTALLTLALSVLLPVSFYFYRQTVENDLLRTVLLAFLLIAAAMLTMMLPYIYQQIVTFDLTLGQIWRNAFTLTLARLPWNLLVLFCSILIVVGIPALLMAFLSTLGALLSTVYWLLIAFALQLLLQHFLVNRQLQRYMIEPLEEAEGVDSEQ